MAFINQNPFKNLIFTEFNNDTRPWSINTTYIYHNPALITDPSYLNPYSVIDANTNNLYIEAVTSDIRILVDNTHRIELNGYTYINNILEVKNDISTNKLTCKTLNAANVQLDLETVIFNDIDVGNNLDVSNNLEVLNDISCLNILINNNLTCFNDIFLHNNLDISGDLYLNNYNKKLIVEGDVSFNKNLDVSGYIIASNFIGDASFGFLDISGDLNVRNITISGHLIPSEDAAYDIGSATKKIRDIYLTGGTLYMDDGNTGLLDVLKIVNGVATFTGIVNIPPYTSNVISSFNDIDVSGNLYLNNSNKKLIVDGDASFNKNIDLSGIITASQFIGDGAFITNLTIPRLDDLSTNFYNYIFYNDISVNNIFNTTLFNTNNIFDLSHNFNELSNNFIDLSNNFKDLSTNFYNYLFYNDISVNNNFNTISFNTYNISDLSHNFNDLSLNFIDLSNNFNDLSTNFNELSNNFIDLSFNFKDLSTNFNDLSTNFYNYVFYNDISVNNIFNTTFFNTNNISDLSHNFKELSHNFIDLSNNFKDLSINYYNYFSNNDISVNNNFNNTLFNTNNISDLSHNFNELSNNFIDLSNNFEDLSINFYNYIFNNDISVNNNFNTILFNTNNISDLSYNFYDLSFNFKDLSYNFYNNSSINNINFTDLSNNFEDLSFNFKDLSTNYYNNSYINNINFTDLSHNFYDLSFNFYDLSFNFLDLSYNLHNLSNNFYNYLNNNDNSLNNVFTLTQNNANNLSTYITNNDTSVNNVYTITKINDNNITDLSTNFYNYDPGFTNFKDASFTNVDISGRLDISGIITINGFFNTLPEQLESSIMEYIPLTDANPYGGQTLYDIFVDICDSIILKDSDNSFGHIDISGDLNITGNTFIHNITISGHLIPSEDGVYDIGSATKKIRDLYLTGGTLYMDDGNSGVVDVLKVVDGVPTFTGTVVIPDNSNVISSFNDLEISGNLYLNNINKKLIVNGDASFNNNIDVSGNIIASKFIGDGSLLTGINLNEFDDLSSNFINYVYSNDISVNYVYSIAETNFINLFDLSNNFYTSNSTNINDLSSNILDLSTNVYTYITNNDISVNYVFSITETNFNNINDLSTNLNTYITNNDSSLNNVFSDLNTYITNNDSSLNNVFSDFNTYKIDNDTSLNNVFSDFNTYKIDNDSSLNNVFSDFNTYITNNDTSVNNVFSDLNTYTTNNDISVNNIFSNLNTYITNNDSSVNYVFSITETNFNNINDLSTNLNTYITNNDISVNNIFSDLNTYITNNDSSVNYVFSVTETNFNNINDLSTNFYNYDPGLKNYNDVSFNILELTGNMHVPSTFIIDPSIVGDNTGLVIIKGSLQIDGSSTIINSSTLDISDHRILLASSSTNITQTYGTGIEVSGNKLFTYETGDTWFSNINITATQFIGDGTLLNIPKLTELSNNFIDLSFNFYNYVFNNDTYEVYVAANTTSVSLTANTPTKLTYNSASVTGSFLQGFTVDTTTNIGRITYTGNRTRTSHSGVTLSWFASVDRIVISLWVAKNGTKLPGSTIKLFYPRDASITTYVSSAIHIFITFNPGDYIELYAQSNTNCTLTIEEANFFGMTLPNVIA